MQTLARLQVQLFLHLPLLSLGGTGLLYFPSVIVLVRGARVRVCGEVIGVDIALVELGRDGGRPDVLQ